MEKLKFEICLRESGERIDKNLTVKLGAGYSRVYAKFLIDNGYVLVNEKKIKPNYAVKENDTVSVTLFSPPGVLELEPEDIPLNIIYEDECVIVINKPVGLVVHPGAGNKNGTLVNALLYYLGHLPESDNETRPGIVHRLDKDTTGVMVVAKNQKALRSLSKQFQKRAIKKNYLALVKGRVEIDNGTIDAPIARHKENRKKMEVDFAAGKSAHTVYHVLKRFDLFTFLRVDLLTGRTHQIRVHMTHISHPILGDLRYGGDPRFPRQALHAERLGFTHPETGEYMEFTAPLAEDMLEIVRKGTF